MKKSSFDVLGLGFACLDTLIMIPSYPDENTKIRSTEIVIQGEGQTSTALVALSRWGLKTAFIGAVGDDQQGEYILDNLKKENAEKSLNSNLFFNSSSNHFFLFSTC